MKFGFSQSEIITTAKSLGLPTDGFIQRRVARAFDLVETNKVSQIDDGIFRVRSQYDPSKSYIVNVNHGEPYCDCPDGERTINCKHRIASLLYLREKERQAKATQMIIRKRQDGVYCIIDGNHLVQVSIMNNKLFCNCKECRQSKQQADCKYKKAIRNGGGGGNGNGSKIANECGSEHAKQLQTKMNGQLDSHNGNGNGAHNVPSQQQLDISDPFQECEQLDIDQIEGRLNGELAHRLSNGEYVISYKGIMTLAEKHGIEYEVSLHDDTNTVIAKAMNGNERVSGKPINGNEVTAIELAKRNAARQLLPYAELKAVEHKAKLEAEFEWQIAYRKCSELAGGKPQVDITINELVKSGKLRQDNPSGYNRTEYLLIYDACQKESQVERDPKSLNRWSYNSAEFIDKCREAINKVREEKKSIEANELPAQNGNGKRKLQMDKKLNTWLVEADGTKKAISCREICEKFESEKNQSIVTRLRAGIDSGADISTVEID